MDNNRGARILDEARAFYRTYYRFPSTVQLDVFTLWTAGITHLRDLNEEYVGRTAPILYIRAATKGAGKSLLADFIELTGGRGKTVFAPNSTYWGVVRQISEGKHAIVLDNIDMLKSGKSNMFGTLIGGAYEHTSLVTQGKQNEEERCIFGPKAITAIGGRLRNNSEFAPVEDRAYTVDVEKVDRDVKLPRFDRFDDHTMATVRAIHKACQKWGQEIAPQARRMRPDRLPDELYSRDLDMWEPAIAVADLAGGEWPARVRRAMRALVLGQYVEPDEDEDPFVGLTPAERTMIECSHVLDRIDGDHMTTVDMLEKMSQLPGGDRWNVPTDETRQRALKRLTMALSSDLGMFGVVRSSVKVPVGDGEYRNGWWAADVLKQRPDELPTFTPAMLDQHARQVEEDDVPFE